MAPAIAAGSTRDGSNRNRASPGSRLTTPGVPPGTAPPADSTFETHPAQCIPLIPNVRCSVFMAERGSVAAARVGGPVLFLARLRLSLLRLGAGGAAAPP